MNRHIRKWLAFFPIALVSPAPAHAEVSISPDVIITGNEIKVLLPGPDLQALVNGITDEALDNPHLIRLGPGKFTVTSALIMSPHISLAGEGEGVTILSGANGSSWQDERSSILVGADNVSITDLTVSNTGGGSHSIAIFNESASPRIQRVKVTASGGTATNFGVYNFDSSDPVMTEVNIQAKGGTAYGVANANSDPEMTFVRTHATIATTAYAVQNFSSAPVMRHVTAIADGSSVSYGVYNDYESAPQIEQSYLYGGTWGLFFLNSTGPSTGARITYTQILGGIANNPTGTQCIGNFDGSLAAVGC